MKRVRQCTTLSFHEAKIKVRKYVRECQGSLRELARVIHLIDLFYLADNEEGIGQLEQIGVNLSLGEVLAFLTPLLENHANQGNDDALHVHQEAALLMAPIWKWITEKLNKSEVPLIGKENCEKLVHEWIDELGRSREHSQIFSTLGDRSGIQKLRQFLSDARFQEALRSHWDSLENGLTGMRVWQSVVTFCESHAEYKQAFLIQGLWDSITAFSFQKNSMSCPRGIAERFLLWARDLFDVSLFDNMIKDIYQDPQYEFFMNIDHEKSALKKYQRIKTFAKFKEKVQQELLDLQPIFMERFKEKYPAGLIERFFDTEKLHSMFILFDDERDLASQDRLRRAFDLLR